jgi:hypothetical protein
MLIQMVLIPTFVLVALTFAQFFWTGRTGSTGRADVAEGGRAADVLHMLFYVLIALAIQTRHADLIMVLLAWVFVVLQVFRAGFLVSSANSGGSLFFSASALVLLAMWVYFAIRVLFLI